MKKVTTFFSFSSIDSNHPQKIDKMAILRRGGATGGIKRSIMEQSFFFLLYIYYYKAPVGVGSGCVWWGRGRGGEGNHLKKCLLLILKLLEGLVVIVGCVGCDVIWKSLKKIIFHCPVCFANWTMSPVLVDIV